MVVVGWFVVGEQFPAGGVDQAAGRRCNVVKVVIRSAHDCKTTQDYE